MEINVITLSMSLEYDSEEKKHYVKMIKQLKKEGWIEKHTKQENEDDILYYTTKIYREF